MGGSSISRLFAGRAGLAPLLLALLVNAGPAAASSKEARDWVGRMSSALQSLNYEGIFVHRSEDRLSAMHVRHLVDERGEHEYLTTLTGVERRVVRNSGGFGGIPREGSEEGAGYWDNIEQNYRLAVAGRDRVAGRFTRVITIEPKDGYRYGYRLWLEEPTGLLLKSDLLDGDGRVIEQVMFTSLKLLGEDEIEHPPVERDSAGEGQATPPAGSGGGIEPPPVRVGRLPPGFSLVEGVDPFPQEGMRRLTFSDGLASISVFVEPLKEGERPFEGLSRRGAVSAFGAVVDGYQIMVVGEVPEATVKMMGTSIEIGEGS